MRIPDLQYQCFLKFCQTYIFSGLSPDLLNKSASLVAQWYQKEKIKTNTTCQCKRCGFDPWVGKTLWNRKQQPTPVFLPGEFHEQRSLVGYSPWGCKELDTTKRLTHTQTKIIAVNYQSSQDPATECIPSLTQEKKPGKCIPFIFQQNMYCVSTSYQVLIGTMIEKGITEKFTSSWCFHYKGQTIGITDQ